ncbi:hypothetical protein HBA55_07475 [Pseudomaricurvus alkylphenolicus]|jgi:uncharacterized protein (TIGR02001 family)|uniref:TorF family putative porin n=1 Tax=Pseudomaricurvus alkylphenolicus TaxID=1306991 RepID=UPI001420F81A|nr:TorF family putative porin [Pseudomaricurvus alkylphenolicus]NIB39420.1 hypothetical protein [Pseudomaricurvus alkylphenolicus]
MKKMTQLAAAIALATGAMSAAPVMAEGSWSANVGYASEYYYRGFFQKNSSASAGIDYENGGFYVGAWTADVGDGLEVDGYFGYGIETESGFSASLGFTGYYYTGDFDETYEEVNFGLGYGIASLEYSVGTYDDPAEEQDYSFAALTLEHNGFYAKYGTFGKDFEGDYFEAGYGTEIGGFDAGISFIFPDEDIAGDEDEAIVFSIGKSFDL